MQTLLKTGLLVSFCMNFYAISSAAEATASSMNPPEIKITLAHAGKTKAVGTVIFRELKNNEIVIDGTFSGLEPGEHGVHIHENGNCSDVDAGFMKAKEHFNPDATHHGDEINGHAGDLGNIIVDKNGNAKLMLQTNKFNINKSDINHHSVYGKAFIVHAGKDDKKTDPAGNSGNRILCGVIK